VVPNTSAINAKEIATQTKTASLDLFAFKEVEVIIPDTTNVTEILHSHLTPNAEAHPKLMLITVYPRNQARPETLDHGRPFTTAVGHTVPQAESVANVKEIAILTEIVNMDSYVFRDLEILPYPHMPDAEVHQEEMSTIVSHLPLLKTSFLMVDGHTVAKAINAANVREIVTQIEIVVKASFVFREMEILHCLQMLSVEAPQREMSTIVFQNHLQRTHYTTAAGHSVVQIKSAASVTEIVILTEIVELDSFVFREMEIPLSLHMPNAEADLRRMSITVFQRNPLPLNPDPKMSFTTVDGHSVLLEDHVLNAMVIVIQTVTAKVTLFAFREVVILPYLLTQNAEVHLKEMSTTVFPKHLLNHLRILFTMVDGLTVPLENLVTNAKETVIQTVTARATSSASKDPVKTPPSPPMPNVKALQ
jgi:hypothetical protein